MVAPIPQLVLDMKQVKVDIAELKTSVDFAHDSVKNLELKSNAIDRRVSETEKAVELITSLQTKVSKLQREIDEKEQWSRSNNIELKGIPYTKTENLFELLLKLANICDFQLKKEDINFVTRIRSRSSNTGPKSIVACLTNRYLKENFVAAARSHRGISASDLGFANCADKVFVNDHLTENNKLLLNKTKLLAREKNFQFVWVKNCAIHVRKNPTSPILFIKTETDLAKIL
ncbi:unnamed protein product [Plutella xylostella]|uniref:(diamondback moth) hypothetical protein n=1 Tax=Plutella xylostella TaxID=51655 RepID=A0A8S4FUJ8_PLUXY|nr:unnamed protein product [Plutella xylostella]